MFRGLGKKTDSFHVCALTRLTNHIWRRLKLNSSMRSRHVEGCLPPPVPTNAEQKAPTQPGRNMVNSRPEKGIRLTRNAIQRENGGGCDADSNTQQYAWQNLSLGLIRQLRNHRAGWFSLHT